MLIIVLPHTILKTGSPLQWWVFPNSPRGPFTQNLENGFYSVHRVCKQLVELGIGQERRLSLSQHSSLEKCSLTPIQIIPIWYISYNYRSSLDEASQLAKLWFGLCPAGVGGREAPVPFRVLAGILNAISLRTTSGKKTFWKWRENCEGVATINSKCAKEWGLMQS